MCFHFNQLNSAQKLKDRFKVKFDLENEYKPNLYNGFQHPKTAVITNTTPNNIQLYNWGLIPHWAKEDSFRKFTLNARIESISEKPSFRNVINNRCLVIAESFYEWQWLDSKGNQKQKFEISLPNKEIFAFAGLWSNWINPSTGEIVNTYTILTTQANELMSKIHNVKKRMPIIVSQKHEQNWLFGKDYEADNDKLIANKI